MGRRVGKSIKDDVLGWVAEKMGEEKNAAERRLLFGVGEPREVRDTRRKWQQRVTKHFDVQRRKNYLRLTLNKIVREIADGSTDKFDEGERQLLEVYKAMVIELKNEEGQDDEDTESEDAES